MRRCSASAPQTVVRLEVATGTSHDEERKSDLAFTNYFGEVFDFIRSLMSRKMKKQVSSADICEVNTLSSELSA
ncbi:hypothetical protein OESDEN_00453 [Oesophagostomum dentatum]|uniref:Uncharacterized protein n=1 Tax=Oesophagostomum dentatum TaxID=61180 RepID=A0A0B1TVU1_OESDE|nr:hypothetical protein OESDEN_00453 [Oesophagostomum dentatum]